MNPREWLTDQQRDELGVRFAAAVAGFTLVAAEVGRILGTAVEAVAAALPKLPPVEQQK